MVQILQALSFYAKNIVSVGTGPINFTGLYVDDSNIAHLVFYANNNGTNSSAGNLQINLISSASGATSYLGSLLEDAGTTNPTSSPS